ncbi:MAG: hypothetical protein H0X62_14485, partial [Bacteroidetes bacterium]|nr:hypothetical protein [Bacteroidota bacterium]
VLTELSKRIRKDSIVTFRIKRIESILSKLDREATMQLDSMGDIAGCRCLFSSDAAVLEMVKRLEKKFIVKKRRDYISTPKTDGYKAYHLYIESPINNQKLVEVQIRSLESHNWATLVEIVDVLFGKKIKEGQKDEKLERFLFLISKVKLLTIEEKEEIIELEKEYQIYSKLTNLFTKNFIVVRKGWISLVSETNETYFIIEVDENKTTHLFSHSNYDSAEKDYFQKFTDNIGSNVVLIHVDEVNFKKLCRAYSNYVLNSHSFLEQWSIIIFDLVGFYINSKNRKKSKYYIKYYYQNVEEENKQIENELEELNLFYSPNISFTSKKKIDEWVQELKERRKIKAKSDLAIKKLEKQIPKTFFEVLTQP